MKKYIHYGARKFEKGKIKPISNIPFFTKPSGGLWASPVDAPYGWKNWCEAEEFRICEDANSFTFTLKDESKIVHIYSEEDLRKLPMIDSNIDLLKQLPFFYQYFIDYEMLQKMGYDAIELHLSEEKPAVSHERTLYQLMYGWDCDSILVLNPDAVQLEVEKNI